MKKYIILICLALISILGCEREENKAPTTNAYDCNKTGIIHDYTGLDGCGYVIELSTGEILEPVIIDDTSFVFADGKSVTLSYQELTNSASICMVGQTVQITCISELCSKAIIDFGLVSNPSDYPQDECIISEVYIHGNCLEIIVSYSGGCKDHDFVLGVMWPTCGTPPIAPPSLYLCHDSNNDGCEAYITDTLQFDISVLQYADSTSTNFSLRPNFPPSSYIGQFTYNY